MNNTSLVQLLGRTGKLYFIVNNNNFIKDLYIDKNSTRNTLLHPTNQSTYNSLTNNLNVLKRAQTLNIYLLSKNGILNLRGCKNISV